MCGIAGGVAPGDPTLVAEVERMSVALSHRGPDDHGCWVDANSGVVLAHRRLSVIDLSQAGHQPMVSADARWVLVLNGEIYDFADHRLILEEGGVSFRGHSDTEVFLELIAQRGVLEACAEVDGMFAFAAFDRERGVLHLGRDRLGEKPLYYGPVGSCLLFASELSALRQVPGVPSAPDHEAVADFLRWGFVPAPRSILPGIHKVPPGSVVRVDSSGIASEPDSYWSLDETARAGLTYPVDGSGDEWVAEAEALLSASIQRRLVADVPLGAFLSGGLDSSIIVALAQQLSARPVRTFTVAVGGDDDESNAAAAIARHLNTDHTTLPLPEIDALDLARSVATTYDEPFADPSAIPTTLLCRAAREHVTVALSGDGADELLGGYNRYQVADGLPGKMLTLPRPIRSGMGAALTMLSPGRWDRAARLLPGRLPAFGTKLHKLARVLKADSHAGAYLTLAAQWEPEVVLAQPAVGMGADLTDMPGASALQDLLLADQQRTLPDNMLVKVDRASGAVGLEVRVPFLDHRFVAFTWRLPDTAKIRDGQGKWLVRQLLSRYVPAALWQRPKLGFDPPLAEWLRGPLREWAHDLLSPDRLRRQGLLNPDPVAAALAAHDRGSENLDYPLWTLLMLQSWLETGSEGACNR